MEHTLSKSHQIEGTRLPVLCRAGPVDPVAGRRALVAVLGLQGDDAGLVLGSHTERPCSGCRQKLACTLCTGVSGIGADL